MIIGIGMFAAMGMVVDSTNAVVIDVDCALAIATSVAQVDRDELGTKAGQSTWDFVRDQYPHVRCTKQGRFVNVEFLVSTDSSWRGGVIYYRVDIESHEVVEKLKE